MGLNMASNALSRIVAPPFFGWVYAYHPDAPYFICALLIVAMLPVALQVIRLRDRAP
jgi:MFS transporter, DHA1 family, tetracycline resistance protein